MEKQIKEASLLTQCGIAAEKKCMYREALDYYRRAGEIFVTLSLYHPNKEKSYQMKIMGAEVVAKANIMKKNLRDAELKKHHPSLIANQIKTEFQLIPACADLYRKFADYFYSQASDKNSSASKKQMLKSAINAHIVEVEIKKELLKTIVNSDAHTKMQNELLSLVKLMEGYGEIIKQRPEFDEKSWTRKRTDKEYRLMISSSTILNKNYPIWFPSLGIINIYNKYVFEDPDGLIQLSQKQEANLKGWYRAHELFPIYNPKSTAMIPIGVNITGYEVRQNSVGDCSVVSSLAVAAHYEYKLNYTRRIISSLIYPQDPYGNPIYNPSGKYIVRLFLNGLWRQVTIDDRLPAISSTKVLCAHSNKNQLWVPLLEKAYIKVRGGYDFPGSNSAIDLYAFTSWMPERVRLKETDRNKLWTRIYNGSAHNMCMITISTGEIADEDAVGLASCHAYAVLEVIQEGSLKILLVKNPWARFRWNGKYSTNDHVNWTEPLKKKLHFYDLAEKDTGIFWIDFDSAIASFEHMDINWSPELLICRQSVWDLWDCAALTGSGNMLLNPQYCLNFTFDPADKSDDVIVWSILTRIAAPEESRWGEDYFIGMSAYETDKYDKVKYNENALNEVCLTNNEHYLVKTVLSKQRLRTMKYVILVIKQHQITKEFPFNVQILSNCNFSVTKLGADFTTKKTLELNIDESNSGGSFNSPFFYKNPQYIINAAPSGTKTATKASLRLTYTCPEGTFGLPILAKPGHMRRLNAASEDITVCKGKASNTYSNGSVAIESQIDFNTPYTVIFSNYEPNMYGHYSATFESDSKLSIQEIKPEGSGLAAIKINDSWEGSRCGGCGNFKTYFNNPIYCFRLVQPGKFQARLSVTKEVFSNGVVVTEPKSIKCSSNLTIYKANYYYPPEHGSLKLTSGMNKALTTFNGVYTSSGSLLATEKVVLDAGTYVMIPSTFDPGQTAAFTITMYSEPATGCEYVKYQ